MSRSNPEVNLTNPAVRHFEWAGDDGILRYYDKEKKEKVTVELPFRFLVLDVVAEVGGGYKIGKDFVGYFSNAVRNRDLKTSVLTVKTNYQNTTKTEATGVWAEVKNALPKAKFVNALYIAFFDDDGDLKIGKMKLKGAANSAWIEFNRQIGRRQVDEGAYTIKERSELLTNGSTDYYNPIFTWSDKVKAETEAAAIELDGHLQKYFTAYFAQAGTKEQEYSGSDDFHGDAYEPEPVNAPGVRRAYEMADEAF